MIIRPANQNLKKCIETIEGDKNFAFQIGPLQIVSYSETVIINHLSMYGPRRDYAGGKGYKGAIWQSTINLYSENDDKCKAANILETLIGHPSYKKHNPLSLKYDFPENLQPRRIDGVKVIPHILYFTFNPINELNRVDGDRLEFGKLESNLKKRILFPPKPNYHWDSMPEVQKMVEESNIREKASWIK